MIDSFTIANRTDFETEVVGLEFDATNDTLLNTIVRHKKTIAAPFSWFNRARIYAAATFLNGVARFAWNAPYSELYKPGFPASADVWKLQVVLLVKTAEKTPLMCPLV